MYINHPRDIEPGTYFEGAKIVKWHVTDTTSRLDWRPITIELDDGRKLHGFLKISSRIGV